jgi:hypothetical protein
MLGFLGIWEVVALREDVVGTVVCCLVGGLHSVARYQMCIVASERLRATVSESCLHNDHGNTSLGIWTLILIKGIKTSPVVGI